MKIQKSRGLFCHWKLSKISQNCRESIQYSYHMFFNKKKLEKIKEKSEYGFQYLIMGLVKGSHVTTYESRIREESQEGLELRIYTHFLTEKNYKKKNNFLTKSKKRKIFAQYIIIPTFNHNFAQNFNNNPINFFYSFPFREYNLHEAIEVQKMKKKASFL